VHAERVTHQVRIVIEGRVQGVGFRYFVQRRARSLRLTGRVWNRPDGRVEVDAEGERASLEALVDEVRRGPVAAEVSEAHTVWNEGPQRYEEFRTQ